MFPSTQKSGVALSVALSSPLLLFRLAAAAPAVPVGGILPARALEQAGRFENPRAELVVPEAELAGAVGKARVEGTHVEATDLWVGEHDREDLFGVEAQLGLAAGERVRVGWEVGVGG